MHWKDQWTRGEQLFDWKVQLKTLFDHHRSCFQQEKHLFDFFVKCGLPVLYEDLARRLSHSQKDQLRKPFGGAQMRLLLQSESLHDAVQQLVLGEFLSAASPLELAEDELVVSVEQIGRAVVSGSLSKKSRMFGASHLFPVLIRAAEDMRKRFENENLGERVVRESLAPYVAMAMREERLVRFNGFGGDSPLKGSRFVKVVEPGDGPVVEDINVLQAGPVSRRKFEDEHPVGSAAELAEWIEGKINDAREPLICTAEDLEWIRRLCALVFDPQSEGRPETDRLKKAHVLCGLRHVLKFEPPSCFLKLYKLYAGKDRWKLKERVLRQFWLQEFTIGGAKRTLFGVRNTGNKQLRAMPS